MVRRYVGAAITLLLLGFMYFTFVSGVVLQLQAGAMHTCALMSVGTIKCWGLNHDGQLANLDIENVRLAPMTVSGLSGAKAFSAGSFHTCALTDVGDVQCWGWNADGQLGDVDFKETRHKPMKVPGLSNVTAVSAGAYHTCALTNAGEVKCWGRNDYGQLGYARGGHSAPYRVPGLPKVTAVSAGAYHTCALTNAGEVKCWGRNDYGQLGDLDLRESGSMLYWVSGLSGVTAVSAGAYHTCALTNVGEVKCWGRNDYGQLGDPNYEKSRTTPVLVPGLPKVTAVSAGAHHTCALTNACEVSCWGFNFDGQLGNGSTTNRTTPVLVPGLSKVTAISTGTHHACALTSAGVVSCWGRNENGQLGDHSTSNRTTPVIVSGL